MLFLQSQPLIWLPGLNVLQAGITHTLIQAQHYSLGARCPAERHWNVAVPPWLLQFGQAAVNQLDIAPFHHKTDQGCGQQ